MIEEEIVEKIDEDLSHDTLLEVTKSAIKDILRNDSLLKDLPGDITLEEIESQIAVEYGLSITLYIKRDHKETIKVIVPQNATVKELKKAVKSTFKTYQQRKNKHTKISWRYLWINYNLFYDTTALDNDESSIQDYAVTNKVVLTFKKKRRPKKVVSL